MSGILTMKKGKDQQSFIQRKDNLHEDSKNSERRNIPPTTHHPRDLEYCQHQTREAFLPQSGWLSINIYWDILEREQGEERRGREGNV